LRGHQRLFFLLGLLLLWPGLVHGDVYVFNDTISYLRGADTLFLKLFGHQDPFFAAPPGSGAAAPAADAPQAGRTMVLYGRSIYFGLFLYLGFLAGSLWVVVVAQAAAAGAVLVALVRHFVDPADEPAFARACLLTFAVAACTPLPFFVCYLMPDLAVGLALPAMALLLVGWKRERWVWRAGLLALAVCAGLAHSTAVALFVLFGLVGLLCAWRTRRAHVAIPAALVLLAGLGGIAGEAAFGLATRMTTGIDPVRPPFLTARLIEDGPARRYLAERCDPASPFTLCRYPIRGEVTAEGFLWITSRPRGGFKALPIDDAVRVSHEQFRFALAVAQAYPRDTATALARDVVRLATNFSMEEFRPVYMARRMRPDMLFEAVLPGTPLPLDLRVIPALTGLLLLVALGALPWIARSDMPARVKRIVFIVLGAVVANDVICACLSGPFARYNTRVIWSLPLVVTLFAMAWRRRVRCGSAARTAGEAIGDHPA
jgi:hypothetical protein